MSDLSDDARSLVDQVRDVAPPEDADRARLKSLLAARLGPGAFGDGGKLGTPTTGAPPAAGIGTAAKVGIGLGLVGLLVGGALLARRGPTPARAPAPMVTAVTSSTREAPVKAPEPARRPPPEPTRERAPAPSRPSRAPKPSVSAPSVADEVAILTRAYSALKRGDANGALAALDEHARRFPGGALAEERAATRVLALCQLGRTDEARADAARFLARYPNSPQASRVRASCAGDLTTP